MGMARERDPSAFQPCYPHQTFPEWCQNDLPAVTGKEVFVRCPCLPELSDLCQVLWECPEPPVIESLGGSCGSSSAPRDELEPKKVQIAAEEAFLSLCVTDLLQYLSVVPSPGFSAAPHPPDQLLH